MHRQELQQRLRAAFAEELQDCVGSLSRHLLALRKNSEADAMEVHVNELYRATHKLKGAANAVGIGAIEQLCGQMQELLTRVRNRERTLHGALLTLLESATEALSDSLVLLQQESSLNEARLTELQREFQLLARS